MSSLESLAVRSLLSSLSGVPDDDSHIDLSSYSHTQLQLLVQHASHILQLGQLETHFRHSTGQELSCIIPALPKYYLMLLPPSVRTATDTDIANARTIAFQFHLQCAIHNEHVPEVFLYSLHDYIEKLCYFGRDHIVSLLLRTNLTSFCMSKYQRLSSVCLFCLL